ncbi:receptor-like protein Cf-9 [Capsicum annuum]|uniref:receptor-like protein Cf-9 n=1 Tax=Capsicum annuum TaxID=4072 RepID=UPI001FB177EE|nr:receptor-like protein Cf-9 [Capsicum annuum]
MFTINPNGSGGCYNSKTLSWNESTDCCSWNGIHCDEMMGQVIELDLLCSGLLVSFQHLMHLDLMYSGFTGVIPEEISHLSKLQVLSISTVDPYGLRLGSYNFEPLLKNLIQLRKLHLDSVSICSTIPLNFSSYLATLWLPSTQLRGVLPERVFHLSNLEHLDLSFNSLTGPIPSNVSGLQNLQLLYLSSNYLNGTIPSFIFSLPSLQLLDLRNNSFSGKIQEFKFNNTLEFVSVKQNQLQGPIPKSLLDLQDLKLKTAKNWTYTLQCYYIRMHSLLLRRLENKEVYRNYGEQNIL